MEYFAVISGCLLIITTTHTHYISQYQVVEDAGIRALSMSTMRHGVGQIPDMINTIDASLVKSKYN